MGSSHNQYLYNVFTLNQAAKNQAVWWQPAKCWLCFPVRWAGGCNLKGEKILMLNGVNQNKTKRIYFDHSVISLLISVANMLTNQFTCWGRTASVTYNPADLPVTFVNWASSKLSLPLESSKSSSLADWINSGLVISTRNVMFDPRKGSDNHVEKRTT